MSEPGLIHGPNEQCAACFLGQIRPMAAPTPACQIQCSGCLGTMPHSAPTLARSGCMWHVTPIPADLAGTLSWAQTSCSGHHMQCSPRLVGLDAACSSCPQPVRAGTEAGSHAGLARAGPMCGSHPGLARIGTMSSLHAKLASVDAMCGTVLYWPGEGLWFWIWHPGGVPDWPHVGPASGARWWAGSLIFLSSGPYISKTL